MVSSDLTNQIAHVEIKAAIPERFERSHMSINWGTSLR